jgi:hypothetical protein
MVLHGAQRIRRGARSEAGETVLLPSQVAGQKPIADPTPRTMSVLLANGFHRPAYQIGASDKRLARRGAGHCRRAGGTAAGQRCPGPAAHLIGTASPDPPVCVALLMRNNGSSSR